MEGKIWYKVRMPITASDREGPCSLMKRHLLGSLGWFALVLLVALLTSLLNGCASAPTPVFARVEPFKAEPIKRELVLNMPDDKQDIKVQLGAMRQALLDSASLDGVIRVANALQEDLEKTVKNHNLLVDWAIQRKKMEKIGVAGGIAAAAAAFFAGLYLGGR